MTFDMGYIGPDYNGGYRIKFTDLTDTQIYLSVDAGSFGKALTDIFKDFPNDFRDTVYKYMIDCATKYFEAHPNSKGYIRFFELLGEIAEEDYEGDEE